MRLDDFDPSGIENSEIHTLELDKDAELQLQRDGSQSRFTDEYKEFLGLNEPAPTRTAAPDSDSSAAPEQDSNAAPDSDPSAASEQDSTAARSSHPASLVIPAELLPQIFDTDKTKEMTETEEGGLPR